MTDRKTVTNFTVLTFCIAYLVSGVLIALAQFGYRVYSWVDTLPQFCANIPFAIYILSPAIASYIILRRNNKVAGLREWLKTVFNAKSNIYPYVFVVAGLVLYFSFPAGQSLHRRLGGSRMGVYHAAGACEKTRLYSVLHPFRGHLASVAYPAFLHPRDQSCRRRDPFLDVCRSVYGAAVFLWRDLQNIRKKPCVHVCIVSYHVQCRFLCLCLCDNNLAGNDRRKCLDCTDLNCNCFDIRKENSQIVNIIFI